MQVDESRIDGRSNLARLARCYARRQTRLLYQRSCLHELYIGVKEGREIRSHTLSRGQHFPNTTSSLRNKVHLMEVLSLAQRGPKPAKDTYIVALRDSTTMQAETVESSVSMDNGGLSNAEIENIIMASMKAGVPQNGTPPYFE